MEKKSECSNREKKHLIDSRFITTAQGFNVFILILKISTWNDNPYIQAYFLSNISLNCLSLDVNDIRISIGFKFSK